MHEDDTSKGEALRREAPANEAIQCQPLLMCVIKIYKEIQKCFMTKLTVELFLTDKIFRYKDSIFDSVFLGEISEEDKKSFMKHYFLCY